MTSLPLPYDHGLALIRADRRLTQAAKNVAAALAANWARFKSWCWPSNATIAAAVGLADAISAQRALRLLERCGYVRREPDRTNPTGRRIVLAWRLRPSVGAGAGPGEAAAPTERGSSTPSTEPHGIVTPTHTGALARGEPGGTAGGDAPLHGPASRPEVPEPRHEPVAAAGDDPPPAAPAAPARPPFDPDAPLAELATRVPGLPAGTAAPLALVFCERLRVPGHNPMESAPFWTKAIREVMGGEPASRLRAAADAAVSARNRGGAVPGKIAAWVWRRLTELAAAKAAETAAARARAETRAVPAGTSRPAVPRTREEIVAELERSREHSRRFGKGFVRVVAELEHELAAFDGAASGGSG